MFLLIFFRTGNLGAFWGKVKKALMPRILRESAWGDLSEVT